jgi:phage-related protein
LDTHNALHEPAGRLSTTVPILIHSRTGPPTKRRPKLSVRFFRTTEGREPVREWLKSLPKPERKRIGDEIRTVQFGWPVGMPLVRKLDAGLWEVRVDLPNRIGRVLFAIVDQQAVLLHGFIKKSRRIPASDLAVAKQRKGQL